jgi:hypothetical protein
MNKKGLLSIRLIFIDIVFIICWVFFLAPLLSFSGSQMLNNDISGFEAFFYSNLNLLVLFCFLLFNIVMVFLGDSQ